METDFRGKAAVVTGASSGIGRAIAVGLARGGARLFLVGRNAARLCETAALAKPLAASVDWRSVELTQEDEVRGLEQELRAAVARIDILVHSAGIIRLGPPSQMPLEDFDRQFQVNVRAPLHLTQVLLPLMASPGGQLVFINSSAAAHPGVQNGVYAASKSALKTITDSLRQETAGRGFRILSIFPGRTASAMQREVAAFEKADYRPESLIQPEDIAAAVLFALGLPWTVDVTEIAARPFFPAGGK